MIHRPHVRLVPLGDVAQFQALLYDGEISTLRELLQQSPALTTEPLPVDWLDCPINHLIPCVVEVAPDCPLYRPPLQFQVTGEQPAKPAPPVESAGRPTLNDTRAVLLAWQQDISKAASFLLSGLSVLVLCDKLVVEHLWQAIARQAGLIPVPLEAATGHPSSTPGVLPSASLRQQQLGMLRERLNTLKQGDVLVLPHLDLLAGNTDSQLSIEARECTELLYAASDCLLLAFLDPTLYLPPVLVNRFAVRISMAGIPRSVVTANGETGSLTEALIKPQEAACFAEIDADTLYRHVAGLNPVRFRQAITYAVQTHNGKAPLKMAQLYQAIRDFKVQTSELFEVPDVSFEDIGGYDAIKLHLQRALNLLNGVYNLPNERLRRELLPRGFIFYGPPGTGKSLFAKAVASRLNATLLVVSGPEVMDMYVGESERRVRELFAAARRNAPSVLVFDEFDAIALRRSNQGDGGSRAGNAVVTQILTEMDGFRPDVPLLVIGTTNRLDVIDDALLRPSRFQAIAVDLPDRTARRAIAEVYVQRFNLSLDEQDMDWIARQTKGLNGDEIRFLFRELCITRYCEPSSNTSETDRLALLIAQLYQKKQPH